MARKKKVKAPKYKVGDMAYSYQNPTVKRRVTHIRKSDNPDYEHAYKLALYRQGGYSYSSKWINESSLYKRKKSKKKK